MRAKGQMEIMGLTIVVVLIALGILFAVRYTMFDSGDDTLQTFADAQLASHFLNTMTGVTTSCHDASITDLIQDCGLTAGLQCGARNSCGEVEYAIGLMLDASLNKWNKEYYFHFDGPQRLESIEFGSPCTGAQDSKRHPIPLGAGAGSVDLILDICQ